MSNKHLRLTLLGTGSSGGVPRVGGDWGACDPNEPRNRRRRCSALIEVSDASAPGDQLQILIDTSPDLREQLLDTGTRRIDALLFTHDHADQTHGIDDLRALVIRNRAQIDTFMDAPTEATLLPKFRYCFEGQGGYPPILRRQPVIEPYVPFEVKRGGLSLTCLPLAQEHGRIASLGFRFGPVAYCNDVNGLPDDTMAHLTGLDVLVLDALRYAPHPSHAHLDQTLEWIAELKPKLAVLTNLHVDLDYRTLLRDLPDGVIPAYDGWSCELEIGA